MLKSVLEFNIKTCQSYCYVLSMTGQIAALNL